MTPMKIVNICALIAVAFFVLLIAGVVIKSEKEEKETDEQADFDCKVYKGCTVEVWTEVKTGKEITRWYQGDDEDDEEP